MLLLAGADTFALWPADSSGNCSIAAPELTGLITNTEGQSLNGNRLANDLMNLMAVTEVKSTGYQCF